MGTTEKECVTIKLDKTAPNIEGIEDLIVDLNDNVDLTVDVDYDDALSGIDGTLIVTPTSVDTSTTGTKQVTYKVQDMAGNIREVVRNIIVDAEAPTIVFSLVDSSAINNNRANKDFYVRATITDNSGMGIQGGSSCTTNSSSECTPSATFTGTIKDFLISVEGTNRACIQVTDNNNKTSKVCSDAYNLDKTAPVAGTATFTGNLGSNSWYTSNVTVNKVNGSDALSGHSSTTSNISSITSNTTGTVRCTDTATGYSSVSESCSNASTGNWYTHPAFTFGDEELPGFWVGKFEVSGNASRVTIKPSTTNWRGESYSTFFNAIKNMTSFYGLSGDSHMIKNMEWGAVTYLKQSIYGSGNVDINTNNNTEGITGCGATSIGGITSSCNAYNSSYGMNASTTGNIYGVYDMSGGAWDAVMGVSVTSYGTIDVGSSGFSTSLDEKYYDKYAYDTSNDTHSRGKLGDATKETLADYYDYSGGWYGATVAFAESGDSWFIRGANYTDRMTGGVFCYDNWNGGGFTAMTTRAVLTP